MKLMSNESVKQGEARTHALLAAIQALSCVTPFNEIVFLHSGYFTFEGFNSIGVQNVLEVGERKSIRHDLLCRMDAIILKTF